MDLARVMTAVRPVVVDVDPYGTVRGCWGGLGGFLGHDVSTMVGRNVLELVAPCDRDEVATYFLSQSVGEVHTTVLPLPFRVQLLDAEGAAESVDVIPTGRLDDPVAPGWVVVLVPVALQAGASRPLDAELAGAARDEVKQLLAAELEVDNDEWLSHLFLVDLGAGARTVTGSRGTDEALRVAVERGIAAGWRPWSQIGAGVGEFDVPLEHLPAEIAERVGRDGWNLIEAAEARVEGDPVAGFVRFSRAHDEAPLATMRTNVATRIRQLVDVAELLYRRWRDQDQLLVAASTDPLTGLANRDTLQAALSGHDGSVAVLYIDVDRFKDVNDGWSHGVGDQVLVEVARRIAGACRPDDVVARFGGDEFVVLLLDVDDETAERIGDRILSDVARPLQLDEGPISVTVSVGLAPGGDCRDVLDEADRAMLTAKRQGRARLVRA